MMDAQVPRGKSLLGCPAITNLPRLVGCANTRWLPRILTCLQPSFVTSSIASLTLRPIFAACQPDWERREKTRDLTVTGMTSDAPMGLPTST